MKYWEFLIQKEGDETWLPLETQQVEILEGRYRVVAHTDRVNTPMEIRVSQLMTETLKRRRNFSTTDNAVKTEVETVVDTDNIKTINVEAISVS